MDIALDGVHANNIGREIKVPQKVIAMHVLCEVEIAHGDVRASGAEHGVAVSESHGADLPIVKGEGVGRLVVLIGERHEELVGVAEQNLVVTADGNPSFLQPFLKILGGIASEGFIELGLLEQRSSTAHIENGITTVLGKIG